MVVLVEVVAFLAALVLGVLWILVPAPNWEPWIGLCSLVGVASELYRRFGHSSVKENETHEKTKDQLSNWLESHVLTAKLSESLPRALKFAKRIGDTELERWVRMELYGYNKDAGMKYDDLVPEYRAVSGRWLDQFNRVLDISHYPDLGIVNEYRFRFGAEKLEELASRVDMQNIADNQLINLLRKLDFEAVRFCFSPIEVRGVLGVIRNKLAERIFAKLAKMNLQS